MRIAFDATAMPRQRAGAGVYTYHLARSLAAHAEEHPLLLLDPHDAFADLSGYAGVSVRRLAAGGRAARIIGEQRRVPVEVRRWRSDVLHGPHHSLPLLPAASAAVVTIHDITFDLLPWRYSLARRWYMRVATRLGLLRADRVIVPSSFVREVLCRRYGVERGRVHVVYEAPPPGMRPVGDVAERSRVRDRYDLPPSFLLSVGTREPGKSRATLIRALALLRARGVSWPLVVVGQRGWGAEADAEAEGVIATGYVPDADLPVLYSMARMMLFPSLLEGFGLPPLEAMACGTPVIASDRPAMPEVLGDAALYADPRHPAAWADAVARLAADPALAGALQERGLARAARYSWARAAEATLAVYAAALHDGRERGIGDERPLGCPPAPPGRARPRLHWPRRRRGGGAGACVALPRLR